MNPTQELTQEAVKTNGHGQTPGQVADGDQYGQPLHLRVSGRPDKFSFRPKRGSRNGAG